MDYINYFQKPEDFFILHTKLDEDRKNFIEQADVVKIYIDLKLYQMKPKGEKDYIIGIRLYYGTCNEVQDYFLALKYLRKATYFNHSDAQFQIGYCYLVGNGVRRSWKISQKWFSKSAKNGNKKAQLSLSKDEVVKNENNR